MIEQKYSPTRTHATWKPRIAADDVPVFRCPTCGNVYAGVSNGTRLHYTGGGRTLLGQPPYQNLSAPICAACGAPMERLEPIDVADAPEDVQIDFQFRGGFNNNCVKVSWRIADRRAYQLEWVLLKTFTGTQLKYVHEKKYSPLTFAFADEDAYCYCNSDPCKECTFRCKSGMCAYCYVAGLGLVRASFDRIKEDAAVLRQLHELP